MTRKKTNKAPETPPKRLPMLAVFLQDELKRRNMAQLELAQRAKMPKNTLNRIVAGIVAEPKGSQVSQIAHGLGMEFWELYAMMGIGGAPPGTPEQEAAMIAALLVKNPELRAWVDRATRFNPRNRAAVLGYMNGLEDGNNLPTPEEES